MAEEKKAPAKTPAKAAEPAPSPALLRASESQDPAVHQLLAQRQNAADNGDRQAAEAATEQLRQLGFE